MVHFFARQDVCEIVLYLAPLLVNGIVQGLIVFARVKFTIRPKALVRGDYIGGIVLQNVVDLVPGGGQPAAVDFPAQKKGIDDIIPGLAFSLVDLPVSEFTELIPQLLGAKADRLVQLLHQDTLRVHSPHNSRRQSTASGAAGQVAAENLVDDVGSPDESTQ